MVSVAFITCVNSQSLYDQCLAHVAALDKQGFSVELIPVQSQVSIANAYNRAMLSSKAKYKIYLHQDAFILEPLFLHHIRNIFSSDPSIGMIGMLGGRTLPFIQSRQIWLWDCVEIFGQVFVPSANRSFGGMPTANPYEWVTVIDGCLMATQYDLPWREDIFDGFHYYDLSQSLEFWKKDLKVVVPGQQKPWVSHICFQQCDNEFYRLREKFIKEYRPFLAGNVKKGSFSFSHNNKKYRFKV